MFSTQYSIIDKSLNQTTMSSVNQTTMSSVNQTTMRSVNTSHELTIIYEEIVHKIIIIAWGRYEDDTRDITFEMEKTCISHNIEKMLNTVQNCGIDEYGRILQIDNTDFFNKEFGIKADKIKYAFLVKKEFIEKRSLTPINTFKPIKPIKPASRLDK